MHRVMIIFKCFKISWKAWLKSDYFKRCGFYAVAAAGCSLFASILFFAFFHAWIRGVLFLLLTLFNLAYNWFMWFKFVLNEQYGDKEKE